MHKNTLRKEALQKRKLGYSSLASATICKTATSLSVFHKANNVMLYLPTGTEVDTSYLLTLCRYFGKRVFAPRVLNEMDMEAAYVDNKGFKKGAFSIWEPLGFTSSSLDLIFVPGVAFDEKKNRIGYGKGYYDRFLRNKNVTTIGLAFTCQIIPFFPADSHDIKMDIVVTEEGIYS